jgi:hypothetical protein
VRRLTARYSHSARCAQNAPLGRHVAAAGEGASGPVRGAPSSPSSPLVVGYRQVCARHPENQLTVVKLRGLDGLVRTAWAADGRSTAEVTRRETLLKLDDPC